MQPSTPTGLSIPSSFNDILKVNQAAIKFCFNKAFAAEQGKLFELDSLIAQAADIQQINETMQKFGHYHLEQQHAVRIAPATCGNGCIQVVQECHPIRH